MLVIKPISKAIADGDPIRAVIRATGTNQVCFVLFCFVLFCFVLFCFVLFCFVLFCFGLFCFREHKITKCNIGWKDVWAYLPWPRSARGIVARRVSFLNFLLPLVYSSYNKFVVHKNVL